jgi:hypothetical protein
MGGCGSGQHGVKAAVEDCITIGTSALLRYGYLTGAGPGEIIWRNCLGHHLFTLSVAVSTHGDGLMLLLRQTGQVVKLESTPLHFGGLRWWFLCPQCERRCACLHLPAGVEDFACRVCHDLSYRSRQEHRAVLPVIAALARSRRPHFVRKRDRRPDYKPRGWQLQQMKKQLGIIWP